MRGGRISIQTVRMRMERLDERTSATVLPPIENMFKKSEEDPELTKELVESMTFSLYPGAKEFSASSLKAFLSNTSNLKEFRSSGSLGSLLEVIRRTDVKNDCRSEHVENIVTSLHILLKDDMGMMDRLLAHPFGVKTIVRLCKYTEAALQGKCFEMLEWVHKLETGPHELLKHQIIKELLHPTFMYRKTTNLDVRHQAARMIAQITPFAGNKFDAWIFNKILVDPNEKDRNGLTAISGGVGRRRVDGYMEMQLLAAFLSHMAWRDRHSAGPLPFILTIVAHLIEEVKSETFESVEHMQQIMRILVVLSKDYKHADFMWNHSLGSALQYLVRTDFALFRRKSTHKQGSASQEKAKMNQAKKGSKRKSILDTGDRPPSTLLFLSLVKPAGQSQGQQGHSDEINLFCTRYVTILYENIMNIKLEIVHDLVSSGIIGALLFRVGSGSDRDDRFNKIVTHFVHQVILKVMVHQQHKGYHMALTRLVKSSDREVSSEKEEDGKQVENGAASVNALIDAESTKRQRLYVARGEPCPQASDLTAEQLIYFIDPVVLAALDLDPLDKMSVATAFGARLPTAPPSPMASPGKGNAKELPKPRTAPAALSATASTVVAASDVGEKPNSAKTGKLLNLQKPELVIQVLNSPTAPSHHEAGLTPGPGFRKKQAQTPYRMMTADGKPYEYEDSGEESPQLERAILHGTQKEKAILAANTKASSLIAEVSFGRGGVQETAATTVGEHGWNDDEGSVGSLTLPRLEDNHNNSGLHQEESVATENSSKNAHLKKVLAQSVDLRGISNTLVAQGIVENFLQTLSNNITEDPIVVKQSICSLAMLIFGSYWKRATTEAALEALFAITRARAEYFYPFVSIIIDMVMSPEVPIELLESIMLRQKCLGPLIRALYLSGWIFHRKDAVYRCIAKLAFSEHFMSCLIDAQGISVLCREVQLRKAKVRQGQRGGEEEGDGTAKLLNLLKKDLAMIKIQAQVRRRVSNARLQRKRDEHNKLFSAMASTNRSTGRKNEVSSKPKPKK